MFCKTPLNRNSSGRAINKKIPGLHVNLPYGKEGFFDENNKPIQERKNIVFLNTPFLHTTHLRRSTKERKINKFKYEIGNIVPDGFKFPEVLHKNYPKIIQSPWSKITGYKLLKARILTPLRKFKRRLV